MGMHCQVSTHFTESVHFDMETINQEINPNHFTDYSNSDYNDCSINEEQEENIYDSINEEQKIDVNGGCNGEQKKTSNAQDNAQNDVHAEDNAQEQEGRFSYSEIHDYLASQKYPIGFSKADKLALRKRSKFFQVKDGHLYYTGKCKLMFIRYHAYIKAIIYSYLVYHLNCLCSEGLNRRT